MKNIYIYNLANNEFHRLKINLCLIGINILIFVDFEIIYY
jgi:hypothetical protein